MQERGGANPEDTDGVPPKQRVLPSHSMQEREGWGTPEQDAEWGSPPEHRALPYHGMQEQGWLGGTPHREG